MTKVLIEKLEKERLMVELFTNKTPFEKGVMSGIKVAIDIVKQHSDWVPCSERLPETSGKYLVFYSQAYYDGTYFKKFDVVDFQLSINRFDFYHSLISHWQPIQPRSEVQP